MFHYSKLDIKRVAGPQDIPSEPHWAILIFATKSVYVEGDERSRTAPGHGYPAHTDVYPTYEYWAVKSEDVLKKAIAELEEASKKDYSKPGPYVVISVKKLSVKTEIHIEVG